MKGLQPCSWASAFQNQDFIWIYTDSGRGLCAYDPQGKDIVLQPDADDNTLGIAVREALAASRFLSVKEARTFLDYRLDGGEYDDRIKALMHMYGYKRKSAMFRRMKCCGICLSASGIKMSPLIHGRSDNWGRKTTDQIEDVFIPGHSSPEEIGAALRVALSRCVE